MRDSACSRWGHLSDQSPWRFGAASREGPSDSVSRGSGAAGVPPGLSLGLPVSGAGFNGSRKENRLVGGGHRDEKPVLFAAQGPEPQEPKRIRPRVNRSEVEDMLAALADPLPAVRSRADCPTTDPRSEAQLRAVHGARREGHLGGCHGGQIHLSMLCSLCLGESMVFKLCSR